MRAKKLLITFCIVSVAALCMPLHAEGADVETFTNIIPSDFNPIGKMFDPLEEAIPGLRVTGFIRNHTSFVVHKHPFEGTNLQGYMPSASGGMPIVYDKPSYPTRIQNSIWLAQLEFDYTFSDKASLTWINQALYDMAYDLDSGWRDAHGDARDVEDLGYYNQFKDYLRELYVDIKYNKWKFRIGKQQVVWGKIDGGRVMDFINPEDYREGLEWAGDDWEYSRIPLWMLNVQYYANWFGQGNHIQFLWMPDFEYNKTWTAPMESGTYNWPDRVGPLAPWSFNQPEFRIGGVGVQLPPGAPPFPSGGGYDTSPGEIIIPVFESRDKPTDWKISDSSFAVRFGMLVNGWDIRLAYAYMHSYNPYIKLVDAFPLVNDPNLPIPGPGNPLLVKHRYTYYRVHRFGANFEKAYILPIFGEKQLIVRGEALYTANVKIQRDDEGYPLPAWVNRDRFHAAFPILEMSMFTDWFVSVRTEHDWIIGGSQGYLLDGPWERRLDDYEMDFGASVLKFFYHDRAQFLTWFVWRTDHGDTWWRAILKFDFTDYVQGHLAYSEYSGNTNDIFGQFRNRDNIEVGLRYSF